MSAFTECGHDAGVEQSSGASRERKERHLYVHANAVSLHKLGNITFLAALPCLQQTLSSAYGATCSLERERYRCPR